MSAGKSRFLVFCSAHYGRQLQPIAQPVARLDSPLQAAKRARQEVKANPGSVAVVLGPDGFKHETSRTSRASCFEYSDTAAHHKCSYQPG